MKHVKLLGLALLAILALSAVASSVAAAELPEILPVPTAAKPLKFTSKLTGTAILSNTLLTREIKCTEATNTGSFTTQDHGTVLIIFKNCEEPKLKAKCKSSTGAKENGEIWLEGLIELVDLQAEPLELGLWLEPFAHGGEAEKKDLKLVCGALNVEFLGALLAEVDNSKKEKVTSLEKGKVFFALWKQTKDEQNKKTCILLLALCLKGPFELKAKFTAEGAEELVAEEADAEIVFAEEAEIHF